MIIIDPDRNKFVRVINCEHMPNVKVRECIIYVICFYVTAFSKVLSLLFYFTARVLHTFSLLALYINM